MDELKLFRTMMTKGTNERSINQVMWFLCQVLFTLVLTLVYSGVFTSDIMKHFNTLVLDLVDRQDTF